MSPHLSDFAQFSDIEDVEDGVISSEYAEGPPCEKKFDKDMDSPIIFIDHGDEEPSSTKPKTTILDYFKPKSTATSNNAITLLMSSSQRSNDSSFSFSSQISSNFSAPTTHSGPKEPPHSLPKAKSSRSSVYTSYNLRKKLEVLAYAKTHSQVAAARNFKIPRTTIRSWKGLEAVAKSKSKSLLSKGKHVHKGAGRPLSYDADIEDSLVQWILESRDLQLPIQRKTIQHKARLQIQRTNPNFSASDGWLQKFMNRNSLSLRRVTSIQQKLPANLEKKLEKFMDDARALRECHHFRDELIINMDETPIFFDMHRSSTINKKGAREVRVRGTKGGKKRVTFVVGCSASGCMLKPMVIVKGKTNRTITKIKHSKNEVCIVPQVKAWMDHVLMKVWIKEVLVKYTKREHCLLVLDSFRAHLTDDVATALRKANVTTLVIPGGCTSKVQPVDVSLNRPIKDIV